MTVDNFVIINLFALTAYLLILKNILKPLWKSHQYIQIAEFGMTTFLCLNAVGCVDYICLCTSLSPYYESIILSVGIGAMLFILIFSYCTIKYEFKYYKSSYFNERR